MAARELRYQWFHQLLGQRNLSAVALAHHRRDNIETLFLNITKGTGPKGLQGIPPSGEKLIRPILEATPEEILHYLEENQIPWREDRSNAETHYQRNKIRHLVLPLLKEINPGLEDTFLQNIERFRDLNLIFQEAHQEFKSQIQNSTIPDALIHTTVGILLHLEEYLKPFGFTYSDISQIPYISESGKKLISNTHWLIKNQEGWNLLPIPEKTEIDVEIPEPGTYQVGNLKIYIQKINNQNLNFKDKQTAYFHPELIQWPLRIRNKKEGDRFTPFGMKGTKLVSDFLKDEKIAWEERVRQLVLEDQEKILWVVGLRTSDLTKVNPNLAHAIEIRIISG
jgi:tRNA(Ile)-lysidine synthase